MPSCVGISFASVKDFLEFFLFHLCLYLNVRVLRRLSVRDSDTLTDFKEIDEMACQGEQIPELRMTRDTIPGVRQRRLTSYPWMHVER